MLSTYSLGLFLYIYFNKVFLYQNLFISEFLWLCRVAALKGLPVHPFNALIFPILRDCLQSVYIFLSLTMVHFIWHVMTEMLFSLPLTKVGIHFGHVRMCAMLCPISLIIIILDLGPSYTDKLLAFRWVQIAHLS